MMLLYQRCVPSVNERVATDTSRPLFRPFSRSLIIGSLHTPWRMIAPLLLMKCSLIPFV